MAITIHHTPYGAVGKLAQAAGEAQQAVREQDYSFRAATQAKQIQANLQAQRERVGAEMEMQEQRLEQQKVQFESNLELQTAQVSARESATHYNYLNNQKQLQQQAEQFEQQMGMREKAFELESAMKQEAHDLAQQKGGAELDAFLSHQEMIQTNTDSWMNLEGTIPDSMYQQGLMAVRMGKTFTLPATATQSLTPYQKTSIALQMQRMKDSNLKWQMDQEEKYGKKVATAEKEAVEMRKEWAEKQTKPFTPTTMASIEREILHKDSTTIRSEPWLDSTAEEYFMQDYYLFLEGKGGNSLNPTQMKQLRSVFQRGAKAKGYDVEGFSHYMPMIEDRFTSKRASAPPPLPPSMISHPDSTDVMNQPISAGDIDLSALGI